jgi:hypothetical protein
MANRHLPLQFILQFSYAILITLTIFHGIGQMPFAPTIQLLIYYAVELLAKMSEVLNILLFIVL